MDKFAGRENYRNTAFTVNQKKKLHSLFCGFLDLMRISLSLLKKDFKRLILWPFLWQTGLLILTGSLILFSFSPLLRSNWGSFQQGLAEFNAIDFSQEENAVNFIDLVKEKIVGGLLAQNLSGVNGEQVIESFSNSYPGIMWSIFLISGFWMIGQLWIQVRRVYILNNRNYAGILSTPERINLAFYRVLSFTILINLIVTLIAGFGGVSAVFGFVIGLITQAYLLAYFGLSDSLIIYEDKNLITSLQNSYDLSKYFIHKNVIRWSIYYFFNYLFSLVLLISLEFLFVFITLLGQFWFGLMISIIIFFLVQFIIEGFFITFRYVAFYNLRHIGTGVIPDNDSEIIEDKELETLAHGIEKKGVIISKENN